MKINTPALTPILASALRITGKRTTLPSLNCIRLEAKDGMLSVTATNLDVWMNEAVECDGDLPPVLVNAERFDGCVRGRESVEMEADKTLIISGKGFRQSLSLHPLHEFPDTPMAGGERVAVNLGDLAAGLEAVEWNWSKDLAGKPFTQAVLVEASATMLECFSVDGGGKCPCFSLRPSICAPAKFHVPHEAVRQVIDALRKDEPALFVGEKHLTVTHKNGFVTAPLLVMKWPEAKNRFRDEPKEPLGVVGRDALLDACKRCLPLFPEGFGRVDFATGDGLSLYAMNNGDTCKETLDLKDGKDAGFSLDAFRVARLLQNMNDGAVAVSQMANAIAFSQGERLFLLAKLTQAGRKG